MDSKFMALARRTRQLLLLLALLGGVWVVWWRFGPRPGAGATRTLIATNTSTRDAPAIDHGKAGVRDIFSATLLRLRDAENTDTARAFCERLRTELNSLPLPEAARRIREFLESGADVQTRLPFALDAGGTLKTAPSLRVLLMDLLGQIDPQAAAMVAEQVLKRAANADEWAVCLSIYARGTTNPAAGDFLRQKLSEMWANDSWRNDPSTGYLEAFDIAVFVGGTNLLPSLASLVSDRRNPSVAHAAFLALDRLAINDTAATLTSLQKNPELLAGREATRASFFARADVRDMQQKAVLEQYLLNPALAPAELEHFSGLFPNANFMVSYNLLTRMQTPSAETLSRRDRAALQTVDTWLADPRFQKLQPQLQKIRTRLSAFVNMPPSSL